MYYENFIKTFSITSVFCFITDLIFPELRVKKTPRDIVVQNYLEIVPLVVFNLLLSYPVFTVSEDYTKIYGEDYGYAYYLYWLTLTDIIFYSVHRLFHSKNLYLNYHSVHHKYRYTYGIGAIYAHPVDHLSVNLFSTFAPIFIFPPDEKTSLNIIFFSTAYTVIISHGCYKIFNKSHLILHLYFKKNYGLVFTDRCLKTF